MQVDDAFVDAVRKEAGYHDDDRDIIAATLAVAAERGLVVPEGAPRMWGVRTLDGRLHIGRNQINCQEGEIFVRVANAEIKE